MRSKAFHWPCLKVKSKDGHHVASVFHSKKSRNAASHDSNLPFLPDLVGEETWAHPLELIQRPESLDWRSSFPMGRGRTGETSLVVRTPLWFRVQHTPQFEFLWGGIAGVSKSASHPRTVWEFLDSRSSFHQKVIALTKQTIKNNRKRPFCRRFGVVKCLECILMMCPTKMKSKTLLICNQTCCLFDFFNVKRLSLMCFDMLYY